MRQGSSDLSGSRSALACLCVCESAQLGLREFNTHDKVAPDARRSTRSESLLEAFSKLGARQFQARTLSRWWPRHFLIFSFFSNWSNMLSILIIRHLYLNSMQYMLIQFNFCFQKLRQDGLLLLICLLFSIIKYQDMPYAPCYS
jgi:hypothetical protein